MALVPKNMLKSLHAASTIFLALSACYLLMVSLHNAGSDWKIIAPVSAFSVPVMVLLILWYLFAVYRGIARDQKIEVEHPFTTSNAYLLLYKLTPLLGEFAGLAAGWGLNGSNRIFLMVAGGAVFTTLVVWIFVDPVTCMCEMLLPSSRIHRRKRLARAQAEMRKRQSARVFVLKEVEKIEAFERKKWDESLTPLAHKLARLICFECGSVKACQTEVVDIGVQLWQFGGMECMKYIHSKAIEICRDQCKLTDSIDCVSLWWQGIGNWNSWNVSHNHTT